MMHQEKVVKVDKLDKSFGSNHVLRGVDMHLLKGENLVVLGKSGTGKSVLIKCIVNLISPDKGSIDALGIDVVNADDKILNQIRRKIGFLFQGAALYDSMTVKENLEFPLLRGHLRVHRDEVEDKISEALKNVGLENAMYKMPSELSGGMKKRIGLARSLIMEPEIMLYDEPTTGLDPITAGEISELIILIREKFNTSSIVITHDMNCARIISNRMVLLKDGQIAVEGSYDDLSQSDDEQMNSFFKSA